MTNFDRTGTSNTDLQKEATDVAELLDLYTDRVRSMIYQRDARNALFYKTAVIYLVANLLLFFTYIVFKDVGPESTVREFFTRYDEFIAITFLVSTAAMASYFLIHVVHLIHPRKIERQAEIAVENLKRVVVRANQIADQSKKSVTSKFALEVRISEAEAILKLYRAQ